MTRPLVEAAAVGHRITHDDAAKDALVELVENGSAWAAAELHLRRGEAAALGAVTAAAIAALERQGESKSCDDPTGTIEQGSPDVFVGKDKKPAAVVHDDHEVPCEDCFDGPIVEGSAHVFVNGLPWARRGDELDCGALVGEGEPTVLVSAEPRQRKPKRPRPSQTPLGALGALLGVGDLGPVDAALGALLGASRARGRGRGGDGLAAVLEQIAGKEGAAVLGALLGR